MLYPMAGLWSCLATKWMCAPRCRVREAWPKYERGRNGCYGESIQMGDPFHTHCPRCHFKFGCGRQMWQLWRDWSSTSGPPRHGRGASAVPATVTHSKNLSSVSLGRDRCDSYNSPLVPCRAEGTLRYRSISFLADTQDRLGAPQRRMSTRSPRQPRRRIRMVLLSRRRPPIWKGLYAKRMRPRHQLPSL